MQPSVCSTTISLARHSPSTTMADNAPQLVIVGQDAEASLYRCIKFSFKGLLKKMVVRHQRELSFQLRIPINIGPNTLTGHILVEARERVPNFRMLEEMMERRYGQRMRFAIKLKKGQKFLMDQLTLLQDYMQAHPDEQNMTFWKLPDYKKAKKVSVFVWRYRRAFEVVVRAPIQAPIAEELAEEHPAEEEEEEEEEEEAQAKEEEDEWDDCDTDIFLSSTGTGSDCLIIVTTEEEYVVGNLDEGINEEELPPLVPIEQLNEEQPNEEGNNNGEDKGDKEPNEEEEDNMEQQPDPHPRTWTRALRSLSSRLTRRRR